MGESDLISLMEASCFVKSITYLMDEFKGKQMISKLKPQLSFLLFKDNTAVVQSSTTDKRQPRFQDNQNDIPDDQTALHINEPQPRPTY